MDIKPFRIKTQQLYTQVAKLLDNSSYAQDMMKLACLDYREGTDELEHMYLCSLIFLQRDNEGNITGFHVDDNLMRQYCEYVLNSEQFPQFKASEYIYYSTDFINLYSEHVSTRNGDEFKKIIELKRQWHYIVDAYMEYLSPHIVPWANTWGIANVQQLYELIRNNFTYEIWLDAEPRLNKQGSFAERMFNDINNYPEQLRQNVLVAWRVRKAENW